MKSDLTAHIEELLAGEREARRVVSAMCSKEFFTHDRYRPTREQLGRYVSELQKCCPGCTVTDCHDALKKIYVDSFIR